jgi:hypothetical protein
MGGLAEELKRMGKAYLKNVATQSKHNDVLHPQIPRHEIHPARPGRVDEAVGLLVVEPFLHVRREMADEVEL